MLSISVETLDGSGKETGLGFALHLALQDRLTRGRRFSYDYVAAQTTRHLGYVL